MGSHEAYRTIVESDRFREQLRDIDPHPQRTDEFLEGVTWTLARDPTEGTQIASNVWRINSDSALDIPEVSVYYTFDDSEVVLQRIEEVDRDSAVVGMILDDILPL